MKASQKQVSRSPDQQINKVVAAIKDARRNTEKRQEIIVRILPLLSSIDKKYRTEALDLARRVREETGKDLTSRNPAKNKAAVAADSYLQKFIMSRAPKIDKIF